MIGDGETRLTIKQERFARQYVGPCKGNAAAAYRAAGYSANMSNESVWVAACRLLKKAKVRLMVDRLKAEFEAQEAITLPEISAALRRAIDGAAAAEQWGASSQAALGLAKLAGLLVEKREITGDSSAEHLDAVATLAGVPKRGNADPDDDNVVELNQAVRVGTADEGS